MASKKAAKKKAAPKAPPKPRKTATATSKQNYNQALRALPIARQVETKVRNALHRTEGLVKLMARWPLDAFDAVEKLKSAHDDVLAVLEKIPDTFKPPRAPRAELTPGTTVRLTERAIPLYDGILEANETRGLEVVKVAAGRVACKTVNGSKILFPRGHVAREADE